MYIWSRVVDSPHLTSCFRHRSKAEAPRAIRWRSPCRGKNEVMRRVGALALTLSLPLSGPTAAMATSLRMSPIGLDLPSDRRADVITVANTDSEPVNLQVRVFKWTQVDGKDVLEPTSEVFVSPPALSIPAGKSYTIRFVRPATGPVSGEKAYRIFVDELPKPIDPRTVDQGVRMVLRTSLPVFVVDKNAMADLHWHLWQNSDGLHIEVTNDGLRHTKMANLRVTQGDGQPIVFTEGLAGYVLGHSYRRFDLKATPNHPLPRLEIGKPATITMLDDALVVRGTVPVQPE